MASLFSTAPELLYGNKNVTDSPGVAVFTFLYFFGIINLLLKKAGNLSADEYKELLEDLKHTAAVNEAAGDLAKLTQIYEVLDGLKSAAGLI